MKYFSMFSGIGGMEIAIQRAFDKQSAEIEQDRQGWNGDINQVESDVLPTSGASPFCIGYSEIDKYAIQVYEHHFKGHKNYGDATRIVPEELPDFDLLVGGFPCQAFSIAGKRLGFDDTRGTLFFKIARILKVKRPKHFVLENVKGLLSHDNGRTFKTIISTLVELGYGVEWQVLNSKNHGVPQNRERVFIIGYFGGEGYGKVFPIGEDCEQHPKQLDLQKKSNKSCVGTLTARGEDGYPHREMRFVAQAVLTPDRLQKRQNGRRMKEDGEPAFTLTSQDIHGVFNGSRIRRLTPTECERLQGFEDGWTDILSDSQRYKCLGNAVTVNVVQAIMERLHS